MKNKAFNKNKDEDMRRLTEGILEMETERIVEQIAKCKVTDIHGEIELLYIGMLSVCTMVTVCPDAIFDFIEKVSAAQGKYIKENITAEQHEKLREQAKQRFDGVVNTAKTALDMLEKLMPDEI